MIVVITVMLAAANIVLCSLLTPSGEGSTQILLVTSLIDVAGVTVLLLLADSG